MMILAKLIVCALVCFIILASICRINMLDVRRHYVGWPFVYLLIVAFAGGTLADFLTTDQLPSPWAIAGMVAAAINIWVTRDRWPDEAPYMAQRKELRQDRREAERRSYANF